MLNDKAANMLLCYREGGLGRNKERKERLVDISMNQNYR